MVETIPARTANRSAAKYSVGQRNQGIDDFKQDVRVFKFQMRKEISRHKIFAPLREVFHLENAMIENEISKIAVDAEYQLMSAELIRVSGRCDRPLGRLHTR